MNLQQLERELHAVFALDKNSWHSPRHWHRVRAFGEWLCDQHPDADREVVRLFSLFHDCRRLNEGRDPDHGERGAQQARLWCGSHFQLSPARLQLLCDACRDHDRGFATSDPTVGACWDSDRLDLDRVLIHPRASFMSTAAGARLAEVSPLQRCRQAGLELW